MIIRRPTYMGSTGPSWSSLIFSPGGNVAESKRRNAVKPPNGKRSEVKHVLDVAAENFDALWQLWEITRGKAS